MPSLFNLTGLVEKEKRYCFAHGVNADIWEGKYRGMLVSANSAWPFVPSNVEFIIRLGSSERTEMSPS